MHTPTTKESLSPTQSAQKHLELAIRTLLDQKSGTRTELGENALHGLRVLEKILTPAAKNVELTDEQWNAVELCLEVKPSKDPVGDSRERAGRHAILAATYIETLANRQLAVPSAPGKSVERIIDDTRKQTPEVSA